MLSVSRIDLTTTAVRLGLLLMLLAAAAIIGYSVAHQYWIIAGGLLFLPFFIVWPVEVALGLFAFFVPFEEVATISPGTSVPFLVGALAGAGLLAVGIIDNRLERPPRAAFYWTFFVLLAAASILWAYNPDRVLFRLPTAMALLLLYVAATSLKITERELFRVTILAIAGGVVASLLSSSGFYHGIAYQGTGRSTITQGDVASDPNFYAASLMLPLSLAVGHVLSSKNVFFRTAMLGCAGLITFAVLLTMSRGGLLAMLIMILVYALRYRLSWKLLLPVALLCVGLAFLPDVFFTRISTAVETGGAGRTAIWTAGLFAAKHYFFYGAGLENFSDVFWFFAGYAPEYRGVDSASHNIYLATLVELGIAGLVIQLCALRMQLRDASPRRNGPRVPMLISAEAACWAIVVAAFFLNLFWRKSFWLVLIVLALSVKLRAMQEKEARESVSEDGDHAGPEYTRWYHAPSSAALPLGRRVRGGMSSFN